MSDMKRREFRSGLAARGARSSRHRIVRSRMISRARNTSISRLFNYKVPFHITPYATNQHP
jgi:hypothetical protein